MSEITSTQPGDFIALYQGLVKTAVFGFGMNEIGLRSLVDDPPKFTLESASGSLGGWSARYVLPNGSPVELALVQFKKDERTRDRPDLLWGEWTIHIRGPERFPGDDGMVLVFTATHDYVWWIGRPGPLIPVIELPPPTHPLPVDEWLTPANQAKHTAELDAIALEFSTAAGHPDFVPDANTREAYLTGRNRNLKEIHDDMLNRFGGPDPGPCQWSQATSTERDVERETEWRVMAKRLSYIRRRADGYSGTTYQLRTLGGTRLDILQMDRRGRTHVRNPESGHKDWIKGSDLTALLESQALSLYLRYREAWHRISGRGVNIEPTGQELPE